MKLDVALTIAHQSQTMLHRELEWLAQQAAQHRVIVEVGSWTGASTRALADNTSGVVYAVDTWQGTGDGYAHVLKGKPENWLVQEFLANMRGIEHRVIPVPRLSVDGALYLHQLGVRPDMVFIDASHDYANVKADIEAWRPLLAAGGLLCGHDYSSEFLGCMQAVQDCVGKPHVVQRIWWVTL